MNRTLRARAVAAFAIVVAVGLASATQTLASDGGGRVLPPQGRLFGYSLADMARETALFTQTGNNPANYPDTPLQILYLDPTTLDFNEVDGCLYVTGSNEFTTSVRTAYYVPIFNSSDVPPVLGTYPTTPAQSPAYFFGPDQIGGQFEIVVDGSATPVGPAYLVGPVAAPIESVGGSRIITLGVQLTPLRPGTHTVVIGGTLTGPLTVDAYGVECLTFEFTYTVHVVVPGAA